MNTLRTAAGMLALAILVGSCAGGGAASGGPAPTTSVAEDADAVAPGSASAPPTTTTSEPTPGPEVSPLADLVQPAGSLLFDPLATTPVPQPISVDIRSIGVTGAEVRDVGVEPNGEMEIPGAREVGWYRWSSSPGRAGSAVLAAHIAYNDADGVFRNLDDVNVGAGVTIGYDDGSVQDFVIIDVGQYPKNELPVDRIFAKDGDPIVALVTCGGTFNPTLRSYDDNVVAYAIPA
ncbi:MAG: class F sortase [Acidimicrobiales bacterium]